MDPDYREASSDTAYHNSASEINLYETVLIKELWVRISVLRGNLGRELRELLSKGGFRLTKWLSHSLG